MLWYERYDRILYMYHATNYECDTITHVFQAQKKTP